MTAGRVLFLRPTLGQGGADRVTVTLLQHLDRGEFEPQLALVRKEGEYLDRVPADVKIYGLDAARVATATMPLARLLGETRPSILFSTSSGTNAIAVLAQKLSGIRCRVVLSERNVLLHGKVTYKKRAILAFKRTVYPLADEITVVSTGVKSDLVNRLGIAPERIAVVYNPVVTDEMEGLAREDVAHPWFHEDVPIVLGAGRLVMEKDFFTLIEAFARVRATRAARLVILGEGPLKDELQSLVEHKGLGKDVWLAGFDRNPFKYMSGCSTFVLSSRFEGLPGVLIQAMACGAPVVSTDCPYGPNEIITPNEDGFLVPVGDAKTMAERIGFYLERPAAAQEMGARGRASVEKFRVARVMNRYAAALRGGVLN